jgi:Glycosyl transferase family 2
MRSPQISVLLPTVRPGQFRRSFDSIQEAAGRVPYEVIVVADFGAEALECTDPLAHLRCRWFQRSRHGPIGAVEEAFKVSNGAYVFVFNDESTLDNGALEALYDEAIKQPRVVYAPRHIPEYAFTYFGQPFAPFPFVHRDVVAILGGLFDPAYKAFYADPDLGMRAYAAGVPISIVTNAVIRHDNGQDEVKRQNWDQYFNADQATFKARWSHLGEFRDC